MCDYIDFKPNLQSSPQTTEKPTKKPKKSKREVEGPCNIFLSEKFHFIFSILQHRKMFVKN